MRFSRNHETGACETAELERTPLSSYASSKPITVAMATAVLKDGGGYVDAAAECAEGPPAPGSPSAGCIVSVAGANGTGSSARLATVLVTNWDLPAGGNPRAAAVTRAANFSSRDADAIEAANARWWEQFWGSSSVALPGDPVLERFFYAHSYLIGSASRAGTPVPPGLWGPWVHDDSPLWAGDFTLDYNFEANFWGLYATNRVAQATPQHGPIISWG